MSETSVVETLTGIVRQAWRDMLSVYYANTLIWKLLKSGALAFLGVFCWAGGNLFRSYLPGTTLLNYVIAYGALVFFYGPFTHLVIVPLVIRWRRKRGFLNKVARRLSKVNITVFILLVLIVGTYPPGALLLDFDVSSDGGTDINPELECEYSETTVSCELTETEGVAQVVVTSGGNELVVLEQPPYVFEVSRDLMVESVGQKRFVVELRDEDGSMVRRFSRAVPP